MDIVVTGGDGFVARNLFNKVPNAKFTSRKSKGDLFLDLLKPENFDYQSIGKDTIVVHLAAISSPDLCEKEYEMAYNVNVTGSKYFLSKCVEKGAKVLFFSSDAVYGESFNQDVVFDENSKCEPVGKYGEMKFILENEFKDVSDFKVFRLSYVFSKFDKFTSYLIKCVESATEAEVFHPFTRNMVALIDVLDAVKNTVSNFESVKKVTNLCGNDAVSRKDLAEMYCKIVDKRLKFKIVDPSEEFFKVRPRNIFVKSLFLENLLKRPIADIEKAMKLEFNVPA